MKALILKAYNQLAIEEVDRPTVSSTEVLIRIVACGICGSDVHGMDGSTGRRIPPLIMGHEASGVIEEVGQAVEGWNVGDRVTFDSTDFPLGDWYTINGRYNLSENRQVFGVSTSEYRRNGAFAEYLAVPQHLLHRLPDEVSFEYAAMVEPLAVALHAIARAKPQVGASCFVAGAGAIGILLIQALRVAGAGFIAAADLRPDARERALDAGATVALAPDDPQLLSRSKEATGGRGTDFAFEAVGREESVGTALSMLRRGGTAVIVGNLSATARFPLQDIVTREITIKGSCAICGEYPEALQLIAEKKVDLSSQLAAIANLEEGPNWFKRLQEGSVSGKVILKP